MGPQQYSPGQFVSVSLKTNKKYFIFKLRSYFRHGMPAFSHGYGMICACACSCFMVYRMPLLTPLTRVQPIWPYRYRYLYGHTKIEETDTDTDTDTPFQNLYQTETDTDIRFEIHIKQIKIPIIGIYLY